MGVAGIGGRIDVSQLPPGVDVGVGGGANALDAISKTLAAVSPGQMQEVMAGMKVGCHFSFHRSTLFHSSDLNQPVVLPIAIGHRSLRSINRVCCKYSHLHGLTGL